MPTARFKGDTRHLDSAVNRSGKRINTMASQGARSFNVMGTSIGALVHPLGLVAAGTAAIGKSLTFFSDIDKRARQVSALIINAGEAEQAQINQTAAAVASEFNIGQMAALNALYEALSAGASDMEAATEVLVAAAKAQVSAGVDINQAAQYYQQQSGVWNLPAEYIADLTAATERLGSITTAQLVQEFGKVATVAKLANIPIEQLTAAIATLTQSGVIPAETMTQLNRLIAEATNANAKFYKAVQTSTGRTFKELIADGHTIIDILREVKTEYGDAFTTAFGRETGARAALVLLDQADRFNEKLDGMNNAAGELETNYARALDSTAHKIAGVKQGFEDLKFAIGEAVAPILAPALEELAETLTDLAQTPEFTGAMEQLASAMVQIAPALLQLVDPLGKFADAAAELAYAILSTAGPIAEGGADLLSQIPPQLLEAGLYAWLGNKVLGPAGRTAIAKALPRAGGAAASVSTRTAAGAATKSIGSRVAATGIKAGLKTGARTTLAGYLAYEGVRAATGFDPIDQLADDLTDPQGLVDDVEGIAGAINTAIDGVSSAVSKAGQWLFGDASERKQQAQAAQAAADRARANAKEVMRQWTIAENQSVAHYERMRAEETRFLSQSAQAYAQYYNQQLALQAQIEQAYRQPDHNIYYPTAQLPTPFYEQGQTTLGADITAALAERRDHAYSDLVELSAQLRATGTAAQNQQLDDRLAELYRRGDPSEKTLQRIVDWLEQIFGAADASADSLDYLANEQKAAHYYAPVTITAAEGAALR